MEDDLKRPRGRPPGSKNKRKSEEPKKIPPFYIAEFPAEELSGEQLVQRALETWKRKKNFTMQPALYQFNVN